MTAAADTHPVTEHTGTAPMPPATTGTERLTATTVTAAPITGPTVLTGTEPSVPTAPTADRKIHSHSPEITAFAVSGSEINEVIMPEFAFYFGSIPISKYYLPSTVELAEDVANLFKNKNAVLMKNHGIVVGGCDLKEAFY